MSLLALLIQRLRTCWELYRAPAEDRVDRFKVRLR
jgi:hypothetical protein